MDHGFLRCRRTGERESSRLWLCVDLQKIVYSIDGTKK